MMNNTLDRLVLHLPFGGNPSVHKRISTEGYPAVFDDAIGLATALGFGTIHLHNPGLGPDLSVYETPAAGPGDPRVSRMPFNQRPHPDVLAGIRAVREAGHDCTVYVGSPHSSRSHEFEGYIMRRILDPYWAAGATVILDHAADSADGRNDAPTEWLEWLGDYAWNTWRSRLMVEPVAERCAYWAHSFLMSDPGRGTSASPYSIAGCIKPAPGPYDVPQAEAIDWQIAEAARFIREGWPGRVSIPRPAAVALRADPARREAWVRSMSATA